MGVVVAYAAHFIEIDLFSPGWIALLFLGFGTLSVLQSDLIDITYSSIVTYAPFGYRDIVSHGAMRLFARIEVLCGVVLTARTASFTFFEMHLGWGKPV